jgi:hypothetical protein
MKRNICGTLSFILIGLLAVLSSRRMDAKGGGKPKQKPFQSVTFCPLRGQYVVRITGHTDTEKLTDTIEEVVLVRSDEPFDLYVRQGTASIHLVKADESFVEGGIAIWFKDPNLPRTRWRAGAKVDAQTEFRALEFFDAGHFQLRLNFPSRLEEPKVEYRMPDLIDWKTRKIVDDSIDIEIKATAVDFEADWIVSADFKTITSRGHRWPNMGAACGKTWEKYIIFVLFKGVQPYCANVYEIGKGWLNSVEIVETLFRRDVDQKRPESLPRPNSAVVLRQ